MTSLRAVAEERAVLVESEDNRPPEYSDDALALCFATEHGGTVRYVHKWNKWFRWDGRRWAEDDSLLSFDLARKTCRRIAQEAEQIHNNKKIAVNIASAKTVAAVQRLAQSDRRIAATVDQWDRDPWLLNTPAGTVDLKTGAIRPHDPKDHITKITAVSPEGECPLFRKFLNRITANDGDLQDYWQRMLGYSVTGSTREHLIGFCHGPGGNGKSVLLNGAANIMGDYAMTSAVDAFTVSHGDRHPTEVAAMRGARLVIATETEEGRQWAESRIKALTGGDRISARFMRQDFFEFTPQFKLIIAGNHKPGLRSVDEAIRRRFHLVPFNVTIGADERDPDLPEKLKQEWPGILKWMIEGCLRWQEVGLCPPRAVTEATADYLAQQDAIQTWITECCVIDAMFADSSKSLFESWVKWAHASGVEQGRRAGFTDQMHKRGFVEKRFTAGMKFTGIKVAPTMTGGFE